MRHAVTIQIDQATLTTTHVHVNVQLPKMTTRLAWRSEGDEFPPIDTTDSVICIPQRYLKHSGLKAPNRADDLVLYKRRAMEQLWQAIQRDTIQRSLVLSIVGGPGSGKSCGAYAFACGLVDRTKWIVVWLHFVPRGDGFLCVRLDGNAKSTAKWSPNSDHWDPQTLFGVVENETRGLVVFVDDYSEEEKTCVSTFNALKAWSREDPGRRRLVWVVSVASVAISKRSNAMCRQAESMLLGPEDTEEMPNMDNSNNQGDEAMFRLTSWRLEDYYQAVENDELYGTVAEALQSTLVITDTYSGFQWCPLAARRPAPNPSYSAWANAPKAVVSIETRRTLVNIKYCLAGGSAALMFTLSPRQIVSVLERALLAVGSVRDLLSGSIPSSAMAHALLAWYDGDGNATGTRPRLVSAFAARLVAANVVPAAISEFELAFAVNQCLAQYQYILIGSFFPSQ